MSEWKNKSDIRERLEIAVGASLYLGVVLLIMWFRGLL